MALVVYRLPGEPELLMIEGALLPHSFSETQKGFLVYPFAGTGYYIAGKPTSINPAQLSELPLFTAVKGQTSLSREQYLSVLKEFKSDMELERIQKAIFSRIVKFDGDIDPLICFDALHRKYPTAFCYLLISEEVGCWMGATPEKLINEKSGAFEIHSLAGTQAAENPQWSIKEIEEQQLVTDYIGQLLQSNGINHVEIGERETITAGSVAHLRTTFTLKSTPGLLEKLIPLLHPTPAVCGVPTDKARELILKSEEHDRRLYTGFLGPTGISGENHLFVNLRCLQLTETGADLFVGGGITGKSTPEDEWQETEMKSQTLLSVIVGSNIRN